MATAYLEEAKEVTTKHGEKVENHTGLKYNYKAGDMERVNRFLTIGTSGGSYYANERTLTKENAAHFLEMLDKNGLAVVEMIVKVSTEGLAPKQQPAIFALALASAHDNVEVRRAALNAVPAVCRTASTLFQYLQFVTELRGWGRSLKRAVQEWYAEKTVEELAYQVVKYRMRNGYSHKDVLRLGHVISREPAREELYNFIYTDESDVLEDYPELRMVLSYDHLRNASSIEDVLAILKTNKGIPFEAIPNEYLSDKAVWKQLVLNGMPINALMRNLSRMTSLNLLDDNEVLDKILADLENDQKIQKARLHPINILSGLAAYQTGRGRHFNWTPNRNVLDALDGAFYKAFKNVEPTGKRVLLAIDSSGSMTGARPAGFENLTSSQLSAAMALVTVSVERHAEVVTFDSSTRPIALSNRQRLDDVLRMMGFHGGATDCASPYQWAMQNDKSYDAVVMYTDYETNYGSHYDYRTGRFDTNYVYNAIDAQRARGPQDMRVVNVATVANELSFTRATDQNMLDVSGFSSDTPQAINLFVSGRI